MLTDEYMETTLRIAADPKRLGARIGLISVLRISRTPSPTH